MIQTTALRKVFGSIVAVDGVSLSVPRGEVLGFLGPNGAGKSTTMKMITGFLRPTSGSATVDGHDVVSDSMETRRRIGYLPEGAPAYPDMTPEAYLGFICDVRGLRGSHRRTRIAEVARRVHLEGVMRQPIETLSKGYKRRVGLAQALVHDPPVLILDEPTDGLDPNQKHEVRALIRELGKDKAVVLSTHILEEVDAVCDRAVVIAKGRVVMDGTPEDLRRRSRMHNAVRLTVTGSLDALVGDLASAPGVRSVDRLESDDPAAQTCVVLAKDGASIAAAVGDVCRSKGVEVRELRVEAGRLDEVFRTVTTGGEAA